jgi:hypothetical protein
MGLTLEEVGAELAKLPENRVPERTDWAKLSASWTKRIAELERLRVASPDALVAAACHCRTVNLPILVIGPADSVLVLAIGLVTKDFRVSASIRSNSWMVGYSETDLLPLFAFVFAVITRLLTSGTTIKVSYSPA